MKVYQTYSSEETRLLGDRLAKQFPISNFQFSKKKPKQALILALKGDLGAGKTTFAQGFLKGLGVRGRVSSPTFVLIKTYKIKHETYNKVFHIDCYRLKKAKELLDLGLDDILSDPKNIVLVEWPEKVKKYLANKDAVWIRFGHKGLNCRTVAVLKSRHERYNVWNENLTSD